MDSFEIDTVKAEKANAMRKFRRIGQITKLFRFLEVCVALFLISWFSSWLPIAVKISGVYFRLLCGVLVSPKFVFIVGNAIIITLVFKSGRFAGGEGSSSSAGGDIYDEFVKNSENRSRTSSNGAVSEEIMFEDKAVCVEKRVKEEKKIYRRCESESAVLPEKKEDCRKIRKTESFGGKKGKSGEVFEPSAMSNEEFQRTIEAFIAKQLQFQREESMAIVVPNQS